MITFRFFSSVRVLGEDDTTTTITTSAGLVFIRSPWSTPCLIVDQYIFNCHSRKAGRAYWRCHNYSKKQAEQRCRTRCVVVDNQIKAMTGGAHNHMPHTEKIAKILKRNKMPPLSVPKLPIKTQHKNTMQQQQQQQPQQPVKYMRRDFYRVVELQVDNDDDDLPFKF